MKKKIKLKKGDQVIVLCGKDKGKVGEITQILAKKDKVLVAGVNLVTKHKKSQQAENRKPNIVKEAAPIHISNVLYYNEKSKKGERIGYKTTEDGKKVRFLKQSGLEIK